jgi:hypothetical protein
VLNEGQGLHTLSGAVELLQEADGEGGGDSRMMHTREVASSCGTTLKGCGQPLLEQA